MTLSKSIMRANNALTYIGLLGSLSTLLCCALPALLVTFGMGAVMAGLVSTLPWLTVLSEYKAYTFTAAILLLSAASFATWRARNAPCPTDPAQAKLCNKLRRINVSVLAVSWAFVTTGLIVAFVLPRFI